MGQITENRRLFRAGSFCPIYTVSTSRECRCERVFSKVNLIKTDIRNRLTVETVNGTLLAAESAKGPTRAGNCINFEPTREMYSRMTKEKIYGTKKNEDSEDVPDIIFEFET